MDPGQLVFEAQVEPEEVGSARSATTDVFGAVFPGTLVQTTHGDHQLTDRAIKGGNDGQGRERRIQMADHQGASALISGSLAARAGSDWREASYQARAALPTS